MYARRKKWALSRVWVDVTHNSVHAQDTDGLSRIDHFRREIHLEGDLDEAQRARLMEIADRCPVHKTLETGAKIETVMGD